MYRALLILGILGCLLMGVGACGSGKNTAAEPATDASYEVLNDYYRDVNDQNRIFYKTAVDPAWEQLFVYDSIFAGVHHPSSISNESLMRLVTQADLDTIRTRIRESGREVLDKDQFTSLELTRTRDDRSIEISKPIVLGEVAVFRQLGEDAIPIFFLFKEGGRWKVKYTFYQKLDVELLQEDLPSNGE